GQSEVDPQSKLSAAGGKVLILPSPVAGGKISGFFTLGPQTARPGAEGFGTTGHSPCMDDGDAPKRKAGLDAKTVAALLLICVVLTIAAVYYARVLIPTKPPSNSDLMASMDSAIYSPMI
ncbi:hypothetical protein, partial [Acidocella aromatica]|uniref:hypothetical protein n=1 Tax=Acidocella aromatica TaxID=1303579 RepID=UPI001C8534D1